MGKQINNKTIFIYIQSTSQCILLKSLISWWYRQGNRARCLVHVILQPIAQDHAGPEAAEDAGP